MAANTSLEILKALPPILWFLFIVTVVLVRPIREQILPLIESIQGPLGFQFKLAESNIKQLKAQPGKEFGSYQDEKVLKRARRISRELDRLRILWVDDHPEGNIWERKVLRSFGVDIALATTNPEARTLLRHRDFDLVISDIRRDDELENGLDLLKGLQGRGRVQQIPFIFYVGQVDPDKGTPYGAEGITQRPDELFHLVFHVAEKI